MPQFCTRRQLWQPLATVENGLARSFGCLLLLAAAANAVLDAEQLHVSVTGVGRLTVSWASPGGQLAELIVERVNGSLGDANAASTEHRVFTPNTSSYRIQCGPRYHAPCAETTVYSSPLLLHADIAVEPLAVYRYSIEIGNESSSWRQVRAPPAPGARELRLAVVGDIGASQHSASTCQDLARAHGEEALDVAVLLGDLAYADGVASRWDDFGRLFDREGCSRVPWLVLPGNHELEPDELSGEPFVPYRKRWRTPEVEAERVGNNTKVLDWGEYDLQAMYDFGGSFYSLRVGPAHIIVLNPYTHAGPPSAQITWLQEELARIDRSVTPFLIALTHAPWEHSSRVHRVAHEKATRVLRKSSAEMLMNTKVAGDVFFAGHVHAYERSKPIDGVRHFTVGHGGNREGLYRHWQNWAYSAFHASDHYGWGILQLQGSLAKWQARRSDTGVIVDTDEWVTQSSRGALTNNSEGALANNSGGAFTNNSEGAFTNSSGGAPAKNNEGERGASIVGVVVAVLGASVVALASAFLYCKRLQKQLVEAEERTGFKQGSPAIIGASEGLR